MIYIYRINGGEVLRVTSDPVASFDATYEATVTDPTVQAGTNFNNPAHWDGTQIRNATGPEITASAAAALTDLNLQQRAQAIAWLNANPVQRKILRAIVGQLVTQLNVLRQSPSTTFAAITQSQAENAIIAAINAGTFD
jgi:hypothetical protein